MMHLNFHTRYGFKVKSVAYTDIEPRFATVELEMDSGTVTIYLNDVKSAEKLIEAAQEARNTLKDAEFEQKITDALKEDNLI